MNPHNFSKWFACPNYYFSSPFSTDFFWFFATARACDGALPLTFSCTNLFPFQTWLKILFSDLDHHIRSLLKKWFDLKFLRSFSQWSIRSRSRSFAHFDPLCIRAGGFHQVHPQIFGFFWTTSPLSAHLQYCLSAKLANFWTPSPLGADVLNGGPLTRHHYATLTPPAMVLKYVTRTRASSACQIWTL